MADDSSLIDVFLQPGEHFVADAQYRIRTVLGSCVSITLWHPPTRTGGMSHFLLPTRGGAPVAELDGRYGDEALQLILSELWHAGIAPAQCQAKIFGGGDMFPNHKTRGTLAVGRRNGEAARNLLLSHGIEVISESLFGKGHRQIAFDIGSGHVWSRQVAPITERGLMEGIIG